jgi:asparagine synthase (glutamine-hydrolysing)
MCGVAAVISHESLFHLSDLGLMMNRVSHRGPDGYGFLFEKSRDEAQSLILKSDEISQILSSKTQSQILLGHARLSVIDLEPRSGQPFYSAENRSGLVFNGEIYNYLDLRDELEKCGYVFTSEGDAEVLLFSLIHWGVDALQRLRGMFSLVFVDFNRRTMLVARDRFGIKPLYRWESPAGFLAFASEIKQFSCLDSWTSISEKDAISTFILNGLTDYSSLTFFGGVSQIMPGCVHMIDLDTRIEKSVRWYVLPSECDESITYNQTTLSELLSDVIDVHLQSDVEIGSCLSGGIDSSLIVARASQKLENIAKPHMFGTFTAGSNDESIDESGRAERTAHHLGLPNYCTQPSAEEFRQDIEELMWHQEQPFASASIFAQYRVFKLMKAKGVKVALDGQGADELFAGYDDYLSAYVIDSWKRKSPYKGYNVYRTLKRTGRISARSMIYMYLWMVLPTKWMAILSSILNLKDRIFLKSLQSTTKARASAAPLPVLVPSRTLVKQIRYHQFSVGLPMLLRFEDRNSMASSIEARVPFLDHIFVDYAFQIEDSELFQNGYTKSPLRSLLRGLVPDEVIRERKKSGFASEEWTFLLTNIEQVVDEIYRSRTFLESYTSSDFVDHCLDSLRKNHQNKFIWRLYCLALWKRVYEVSEPSI